MLTAEGDVVLEAQYFKEWVDDLIEGQLALTQLAIIVSIEHQPALSEALSQLRKTTDRLLNIPVMPTKLGYEDVTLIRHGGAENILLSLDEIYNLVIGVANQDLNRRKDICY
ncbi:hypothetical protein PN498_28400 [Oscillatoria sp. CS-180]|nr:hypothetical protein [Oscillatoria sp. CS-180]